MVRTGVICSTLSEEISGFSGGCDGNIRDLAGIMLNPGISNTFIFILL